MSKAIERAREGVKRSRIHQEIVGFTDAEADEIARAAVLAFLDEGDEEIRRRIKLGMLACPSDDPDDDARAVVLALRSLAEGKDV